MKTIKSRIWNEKGKKIMIFIIASKKNKHSFLMTSVCCIGNTIHSLHVKVISKNSQAYRNIKLANLSYISIQSQKYRKMHLFEKSNFCQKIQFWQNITIFLGKSKLSTIKKCKSPTFSRVFHHFFDNFSREIKVVNS